MIYRVLQLIYKVVIIICTVVYKEQKVHICTYDLFLIYIYIWAAVTLGK